MADKDIRNLITSTINQHLTRQRRFDAGRLPSAICRKRPASKLLPKLQFPKIWLIYRDLGLFLVSFGG